MSNDTKPEDAIAVGGPLGSLEPPVFFDQGAEFAPAIAFFPNPAGIADEKSPLLDARVQVAGRDGIVRLIKEDVDQLIRFLVDLVELTEPKVEPLPEVVLRTEFADKPAIATAIMSAELLALHKAFGTQPEQTAAAFRQFCQSIWAILGLDDTGRLHGANVVLAAARQTLQGYKEKADAAQRGMGGRYRRSARRAPEAECAMKLSHRLQTLLFEDPVAGERVFYGALGFSLGQQRWVLACSLIFFAWLGSRTRRKERWAR